MQTEAVQPDDTKPRCGFLETAGGSFPITVPWMISSLFLTTIPALNRCQLHECILIEPGAIHKMVIKSHVCSDSQYLPET